MASTFDGRRFAVTYSLHVANDSRRARLVQLVATCGTLDMDDPQPAITIMVPGED